MTEQAALVKAGHEKWLLNWQTKTRPLMTGMLVALAVVFFVGSAVQLVYLNIQMTQSPILQTAQLIDDSFCYRSGVPQVQMSALECNRIVKERALVLLESNVVARRYHQANALVMFGVWSRYLGFVTGMVLAMVGSAFILGKLTEPPTSIETSASDWKASIRSSSPGLVMCFLGAILIVASITTLNTLQTRDVAVYLSSSPQVERRVPDDGRSIKDQIADTPSTSVK